MTVVTFGASFLTPSATNLTAPYSGVVPVMPTISGFNAIVSSTNSSRDRLSTSPSIIRTSAPTFKTAEARYMMGNGALTHLLPTLYLFL